MRTPRIAPSTLCGLCLLAGCASPPAPALPGAARTASREISASGSATVPLPPDHVSITVGVTTTGGPLASALSAHRAKVGAVVRAIKRRGVPPGSIDVARDGIGAIPFGGDAIASYRISSRIVVTLEGIDGADDVLRAATKAGVNQIGEVRYFASDRTEAEHEGLARAYRNARSKAELLASQSGGTLGGVLSVADGGGGRPVGGTLRSGVGPVIWGMGSPGSEEMTVSVSVTYALR